MNLIIKNKARILIACEYTQAVTIAFRKLGFQAFSCDIISCTGWHPEWHIMDDVLNLLNDYWDMIIAFPPCTYLTWAGTASWNAPGRFEKRIDAARFFMKFVNCKCKKIGIENPQGIMSQLYRKPDQVIHPYLFGDPFKKRTCLWLKNLPLLKPTNLLPEPEAIFHESTTGRPVNWVSSVGRKDNCHELRSRTFPGIAEAMAEQWSKLLIVN